MPPSRLIIAPVSSAGGSLGFLGCDVSLHVSSQPVVLREDLAVVWYFSMRTLQVERFRLGENVVVLTQQTNVSLAFYALNTTFLSAHASVLTAG